MATRKFVRVNVSWCYGDCSPTAKLTLSEWAQVQGGEQVTAGARYRYEGEWFYAVFHFNTGHLRQSEAGSLLVTYDGDGEGFIGDIEDAKITGAPDVIRVRPPG